MALDPNRQLIEIAYSETPAEVPTGLEKGELGVNLVDTPPRLYVGGSGGPLLLVGGPTAFLPLVGGTISGNPGSLSIGAPVVPTGGLLEGDINVERLLLDGEVIEPLPDGGNLNDVLTRGSGTDIEWRIPGLRGNNEMVLGSGTGNGANTITLGNTASTALYTRAGLVLNNATGGSQGLGTVNASGPIYVNGQKIGGFAPSIAWAEGTDPDGISIFVNNTGRTLTVIAISGVVERKNGLPAVVSIVKAARDTALAGGIEVHTSVPFDADGPEGETQDLTPAMDNTLPPDWRLGLQASSQTGTWDDSVAVMTVYLE